MPDDRDPNKEQKAKLPLYTSFSAIFWGQTALFLPLPYSSSLHHRNPARSRRSLIMFPPMTIPRCCRPKKPSAAWQSSPLLP